MAFHYGIINPKAGGILHLNIIKYLLGIKLI